MPILPREAHRWGPAAFCSTLGWKTMNIEERHSLNLLKKHDLTIKTDVSEGRRDKTKVVEDWDSLARAKNENSRIKQISPS